MKLLIYIALFMISALALGQTTMNDTTKLSNQVTPNQNEELEDKQEMEDPNQEDIGIEGVENQDSPSDTVPETTPSF